MEGSCVLTVKASSKVGVDHCEWKFGKKTLCQRALVVFVHALIVLEKRVKQKNAIVNTFVVIECCRQSTQVMMKKVRRCFSSSQAKMSRREDAVPQLSLEVDRSSFQKKMTC